MAKIWFKNPTIQAIHERGKNTMLECLGMKITEIDDASLTGTMPVDHRTKQPQGLLHGGASVALAETLASIAANLVVDTETHYCVGLEINANHISSCRDGVVTGTTTPIHIGGTTQIWEIKIRQDARLVCISRITMAVLKRKPS